MRFNLSVFAAFTALIVSGCSGATAAQLTSPSSSPSSPSQSQAPSLVGMWQGSTRSEVTRVSDGSAIGFNLNCSQRWEFTSQTAGEVEGTTYGYGSGPESDWRCAQSGSLKGHATSGTAFTLELDPPYLPGGCREGEGGRFATGTLLPDGSLQVEFTARGDCALLWGAGSSGPRDDLAFDIRFTLTRR